MKGFRNLLPGMLPVRGEQGRRGGGVGWWQVGGSQRGADKGVGGEGEGRGEAQMSGVAELATGNVAWEGNNGF